MNVTVMDVLCRKECPIALASYRKNVESACSRDPQPREGFPSTYWVDSVSSVQAQMCLKDSKTGVYCTGEYYLPNLSEIASLLINPIKSFCPVI